MRRRLWLWLYERRARIPIRLRRLKCRLFGHHPNYHSFPSDPCAELVTVTSYGPCLWCGYVVAEGEMVETFHRYGRAVARHNAQSPHR